MISITISHNNKIKLILLHICKRAIENSLQKNRGIAVKIPWDYQWWVIREYRNESLRLNLRRKPFSWSVIYDLPLLFRYRFRWLDPVSNLWDFTLQKQPWSFVHAYEPPVVWIWRIIMSQWSRASLTIAEHAISIPRISGMLLWWFVKISMIKKSSILYPLYPRRSALFKDALCVAIRGTRESTSLFWVSSLTDDEDIAHMGWNDSNSN